jgi:5-methylthioribose kinase
MDFNIEDFEALRNYLMARGCVKSGETVSFTNLRGGVSNRTVKVAWPDGHGWVLKQALAKLRVSADWFSSPARIAVEAKALRCLNQMAPPGTTPAFIFEDMPHYLMAMEAIPEEHENWKTVLLSRRIIPDHFEQFGLLLGAIHRRSSESIAEVRELFLDTTYFEDLRLEPYYGHAAQTTPEAAPFLNKLVEETLRHKDCMVHGDFSPKNTLIYRDKLILLDYEVVHIGDPAFDVGFALTHFLSKAHHLPSERARLASAAKLFWETYRAEIMRLDWAHENDLEPRVVAHTLACLLARVSGKSPLEYLTSIEKTRQRSAVLGLMREPPTKTAVLIHEFIQKIETYAQD